MAKARKRAAVSKKGSKRGKASAKPARKMAVKQATLKKAKSKVQRPGMRAKKSAARKKPPETMESRPVAEMPVETTIIGVIEEPAPGVVAVTEYESIRTATSISTVGEPERGEGIGLAGTSPMVPDQGERPEHGAEEQRDALME
jgi:hypothetical protein